MPRTWDGDVDLVAHVERVSRVLVRGGTASLDHEIRHDPMERQAVVVAARARRTNRATVSGAAPREADEKDLAALHLYARGLAWQIGRRRQRPDAAASCGSISCSFPVHC